MHSSEVIVRIAVRTEEARQVLEGILRDEEGFELLQEGDSSRPDLLVFELGPDTDKDFKYISAMLAEGAVGEVFLTQEDPESEVLLQAIRTGAKEFFSLPLKEEDVREALGRCRSRRAAVEPSKPVKQGQIVNVIGAKGGVGSTTVAVNLAVSLAGLEGVESVALMDMNMLFGEVPLFLDIKPRYHWGEIAKQIYRLDRDFLMNTLTRHSTGVYVLSSPSSLYHDQEGIAKIMERLLGLMKRTFDFVVVDAGHTLDRVSSRVMELSDQVLLVSVLSLPCITNTKKLLESFQLLGYPKQDRIKIVVNRHMNHSEITAKDAGEDIEQKVFWTLPNHYQATMAAINKGKPLAQAAARASITQSIGDMAKALAGGDEPAERKKKGWRLFSGRK